MHGQSQNVTNRVNYHVKYRDELGELRPAVSRLIDLTLALPPQPLDLEPEGIVLFRLPCQEMPRESGLGGDSGAGMEKTKNIKKRGIGHGRSF